MKNHDLNKLLENNDLLNEKINEFKEKGILRIQNIDRKEINGHLQKADNDLRFVAKNIDFGFSDWAITGCYFSCYHAALALILTRNYFSKNHLATLCILIKEFYRKELTREDIITLSNLLDYEDVQFYVESKNKREDATYSTNIIFDKNEVNKLRINSALFVSKIKGIIKEEEI